MALDRGAAWLRPVSSLSLISPLAPMTASTSSPSDPRASRRSFLKLAGIGGAVLVAGCDSDDPDPAPATVVLDFSGDTGVLNYAYALEQLEAAFYTMVTADAAFSNTFSADEQRLLRDLRDHEVIHREFLSTALGNDAIPGLTPNFAGVDFADRASVLGTAQVFEDLGVAAYNGAGQFLSDPGLLTIAGKIVSVEARHAAAIRDVLQPRSAAALGEGGGGLEDVVNDNGLDRALAPNDVLMAAADFIEETFDVRNAG
jgi:hypothetical protein